MNVLLLLLNDMCDDPSVSDRYTLYAEFIVYKKPYIRNTNISKVYEISKQRFIWAEKLRDLCLYAIKMLKF